VPGARSVARVGRSEQIHLIDEQEQKKSAVTVPDAAAEQGFRPVKGVSVGRRALQQAGAVSGRDGRSA
jgi:hypothetical protein